MLMLILLLMTFPWMYPLTGYFHTALSLSPNAKYIIYHILVYRIKSNHVTKYFYNKIFEKRTLKKKHSNRSTNYIKEREIPFDL